MPTCGADRGYEDYIRDRLRRGGWTPLYFDHLRVLSPSQALVLGLILNVSKMGTNPDGWVRLTPSFAESQIHMDAERQQQVPENLRKKRVVEIQQRHGGRHVRLDVERLERLVAEAL